MQFSILKNKNQKIIITKRIAMNIYLATHTDVNLLFHEAGHYFISADTHRETHTHIQRDTQCTSCFAAKSMGKFNRALRCARNLLACWLVSIYCSFTVFECVCVCASVFLTLQSTQVWWGEEVKMLLRNICQWLHRHTHTLHAYFTHHLPPEKE